MSCQKQKVPCVPADVANKIMECARALEHMQIDVVLASKHYQNYSTYGYHSDDTETISVTRSMRDPVELVQVNMSPCRVCACAPSCDGTWHCRCLSGKTVASTTTGNQTTNQSCSPRKLAQWRGPSHCVGAACWRRI